MMGQFILLTYSYIIVLLFFWALLLALSFGHILRQSRMERQELLVLVSPSHKNVSSKHLLAYIHSPLDEMQAWQSKPEKIDQQLGQIMLPMRYRQTLLFADDLAETSPNPVTKLP
jgi:hypothetical protein